MMIKRAVLPALLSSLALFACGDNGDDDGFETRDYPVCQYDFEATIRSGPDAGLAVHGELTLADLGDLKSGTAVGELVLDDEAGSRIVVSAKTGADLDLYFWLADGTMIHGNGTLTSSVGSCPARIEGSALGPHEGSVGDWLAIGTVNLTCTIQCGCPFDAQSATPACQNACILLGLDPSTTAGATCVQGCVTNELNEGCTCTEQHFGAGVSTFFPTAGCSPR